MLFGLAAGDDVAAEIEKGALLAVVGELELPGVVDLADHRSLALDLPEDLDDALGVLGGTGVDESASLVAEEPPDEIGAVLGDGDPVQVHLSAHLGGLEEHSEGTHGTGVAHVLSRMCQLLVRDDRRSLHLALHELGILVEGGEPRVGDVVGVMAVEVHHEDDVVAGFGGAAADEAVLLDLPDDGDVDGVVVAVGMGVSAHDGDAEPPDPFLHAPEEHAADAVVGHGDHIDHGGGTASHGRDVVHVHEDREVTRHVGVGLDQGFHDAVGGEEDVAVPHLDGCRILSLGRCHAGEGVGGQEVHHLVDLALPGDSREVPDRIDYGLEFHIHHSASMGCTTTCHHPSML